MKGFYTNAGYCGLVNGEYVLFASESDYYDAVEDELISLLQNEEDPTFSIYSDESVPIREVVGIMNIAKRNHYKVILATQPE